MKMFDFLPTIFVTSLCAMDDVATNILMKREESNAQARSVKKGGRVDYSGPRKVTRSAKTQLRKDS